MFSRKRSRYAIAKAYIDLFRTDNGKIVLEDLINTFHILHSTMTNDANQTAFREGERSVVLRILKTINTDPVTLENYFKHREGTIE